MTNLNGIEPANRFRLAQAQVKNDTFSSVKTFTYAITGTAHGSLVVAESEEQARELFRKVWNGESILHVKELKGTYF